MRWTVFFITCWQCAINIQVFVHRVELIIKLNSKRGMHFVKLHPVSPTQNNAEIFNQLLARPHHRAKEQKSESESPPIHARTQSSYYSPQHAFALEPILGHPHPSRNPETPRSPQGQIGRKEPGMKLRKSSENNIIHEHEELQLEKGDPFSSRIVEGFVRTPKQIGRGGKERKGSCNIEPTFFRKGRKDSENNSGPEKVVRRDVKLVKKASNGWDENNNFQFSSNQPSDEPPASTETPSLTEIPRIQNIRKQSDNDSPKKQVPSFLAAFKSHKNSLDPLEMRKSKISIENFMILRELGQGTFGRVVLAVERESKLMFAIKIISKREIQKSNMVEQLTRQLRIQMSINHPNVIKVYGFFDDLLHFYILMECALDGPLTQNLRKRPAPFSEPEAAAVMSQLCNAIAYLHTESIIHRDLKPDNILFHQGVAKITDFGWSVKQDGRLRSTFCGTPVYLCPEILMGDEYDESVDIWTVGAILYEMLYRNNPFRITCKEELVNILNQPIQFDEKPEVTETAKDFIRLCLSKRATERPNIRELQLHQFLFNAVALEENRR